MPEVSSIPDPPGLEGLPQQVAATFDKESILARALPSFEARNGQRQMAIAVAEVFKSGGLLMVEAGTGTGKTLAYLVPAILSKRQVLVSTGTKQLQDQIYYKDLPALQNALGLDFSAAYMKGRGNYLCLHRLNAYRTGDLLASPGDQTTIETIAEWAEQTNTGDRSEIEDLPDNLPLWNKISGTSENCIGSDCPKHQECFVTQMRQQAAESDVVIVNHHLLCADAAVRQSAYGEVIPSCTYMVIDEAHGLEDVATQYFGIAVSSSKLERLINDGRRNIDQGLFETPNESEHLAKAIEDLNDKAKEFFTAVQDHRPIPERIRMGSKLLERMTAPGRQLASSLRAIGLTLDLVDEPSEDLLSFGRRADELSTQIDFLLDANDDRFVYFLEHQGQGPLVRASPIDVSSIIREVLLKRMQTTIVTSATLAVDGSFDYQRSRLGIENGSELQLASEFNYADQTVLYLPRQMPEPREPNFAKASAEQICQLLEATKGRAFLLFTSYANMHEVHQLIESTLPFPLFVQGTSPRSVLLRDFRCTTNAVLLATASFWQGIDVVGDRLSCVVIDKLPFSPPGDPITSARLELIAKRGGNPFNEYQVPLAVLSLLQGFGRLIRHRQDRGVLSILDPRVITKGYGRRFLASLSSTPIVREVDQVSRFLDK
ncbi:MAG: helicase [Acidobacteria bacterium]|nr:helicase [Acidobacteriota bacterium]